MSDAREVAALVPFSNSPRPVLPDMHWMKRKISVIAVAGELGLELHGRQIRCWRPENHQRGDRTPSVGVDMRRNRVKCFVCDDRALSVIDLVQSVLGFETYDAVLWLDHRFEVPPVEPGKRFRGSPGPVPFRVGTSGSRLEGAVRSGLFAEMKHSDVRLLIVLDVFADSVTRVATLSYAGLRRYAGIGEATVCRALKRLENLGAIQIIRGRGGDGLAACNRYMMTLDDARFLALMNKAALVQRREIAAEREARTKLRRQATVPIKAEKPNSALTGDTSCSGMRVGSLIPRSPENSG